MKEKKVNCGLCKYFRIKDLGNGFCEILCDKDEVNLPYHPCEVYEEKLKSNEQNGE
nr:MAG TPA: hypothetical protein [Caudoviricetes sp.]